MTFSANRRISHVPGRFLAQVEAALDCAFEPVVDIHSGDIYGFETTYTDLEKLGVSSISDLFDHAETMKCVADVELLVQRKAIQAFSRLPSAVRTRLFVKLDPRGLLAKGATLDAMQETATAQGLAAWNICIDIPDLERQGADEALTLFSQAARERGFTLALDDFGRGYARLRILYQLEPGILKIDRFFITALQSDARKRLIVSSLVDFAHVLGIRVIATGVETIAELQACRSVGCDLVHGSLISRPLEDPAMVRPNYPLPQSVDRRLEGKRKADRDFLDQEMEHLAPIHAHENVARALEVFRANPTQSVLPVLDGNEEPVGIIRERDLKSFLYMSYGRDLLLNPTIDNHLKGFVRSCPVADMQAPLERLVDAGGTELGDGILMTEGGTYAGWLSTTALLKISNEARLQIAQDQNPLTKLPGNSAISDHVTRTSASPETDRAYCYIDFDNFKPFNDTYGFRIGDRAIILFSDLLKRRLGGMRQFIGHVGGDDFFVGIDGWEPKRVTRLMADMREEFARQVESLYSADHRKRGFIVAEDRRGRSQIYPLLTTSMAVLHLPKGISIGNLDLLSNHIARLKHRSKAEASGLAVSSFGADETAEEERAVVARLPTPNTRAKGASDEAIA
ncbi:EAL domain-containing protein [Stappia sp. ICDLI1TA098]